MKDTEFFERALGLKGPWKVKEVKMEASGYDADDNGGAGGGVAGEVCRWEHAHGEGAVGPGQRSRWTLAFEGLAVSVLRNARSITQAAELLAWDWSSARAIMGRAVERGLARRRGEELSVVSIDDKSFGPGQNSVSVLSDPVGKRVFFLPFPFFPEEPVFEIFLRLFPTIRFTWIPNNL